MFSEPEPSSPSRRTIEPPPMPAIPPCRQSRRSSDPSRGELSDFGPSGDAASACGPPSACAASGCGAPGFGSGSVAGLAGWGSDAPEPQAARRSVTASDVALTRRVIPRSVASIRTELRVPRR
jgi:hypothetical protein